MHPGGQADTCPWCGLMTKSVYDLPHIWHQRKTDTRYRIVGCDCCAFSYLLPRPTPKELSVWYGDEYFSNYAEGSGNGHAHSSTFLDRIRVHIAWRLDRGTRLSPSLLQTLITCPGAAICDIGCGNGDWLLQLKSAGFGVLGIEPDEAARRRAMAKGLDVRPGYAESLPADLPPSSFDAVTMLHVLEHCLDPFVAIKKASGLIRPGGYIVIEVPNNESLGAQQSGIAWFHADIGRHLNFFTAKGLSALAEKAGLGLERVEYDGYVAQFKDSCISAEQRVWDKLFQAEGGLEGRRTPEKSSKKRSWGLLIRSAMTDAAKKYVALRVYLRKH